MDGLRPIRDQVMNCGVIWPSAEGQVTVHMQIAPDGRVVHIAVTQSPHDGLGACVADAMAKASFAATRNGSSFTYPWEFAASPAAPPGLPPPPPPTASCAQQVAYLQDFLHHLDHLDSGDPAIAPPWPIGDKRRDHHIDELLKAFRAAMKPEEKGSHFLPLNMMNITPGELERLYARCPASLASLKKVDKASPEERWTYWHQAVDHLTSCACRADLAALRVFYYLVYRGPF